MVALTNFPRYFVYYRLGDYKFEGDAILPNMKNLNLEAVVRESFSTSFRQDKFSLVDLFIESNDNEDTLDTLMKMSAELTGTFSKAMAANFWMLNFEVTESAAFQKNALKSLETAYELYDKVQNIKAISNEDKTHIRVGKEFKDWVNGTYDALIVQFDDIQDKKIDNALKGALSMQWNTTAARERKEDTKKEDETYKIFYDFVELLKLVSTKAADAKAANSRKKSGYVLRQMRNGKEGNEEASVDDKKLFKNMLDSSVLKRRSAMKIDEDDDSEEESDEFQAAFYDAAFKASLDPSLDALQRSVDIGNGDLAGKAVQENKLFYKKICTRIDLVISKLFSNGEVVSQINSKISSGGVNVESCIDAIAVYAHLTVAGLR